MKKVININFQGQVIAIEETAYEILKQYIESLTSYFSREEEGSEIVNDIECRIAELFGNRLKHGINCITDEDVEAIISNIGRPQDFDSDFEESVDEDAAPHLSASAAGREEREQPMSAERRSLYRNANDQIIGGVCSGLAHYFKTDPVWMRIVFVLFFGFLFWVYIVLWIVLKPKALVSNVAKRLYRNPSDRFIGGVCGGMAAYFKIDSWIPRIIFLVPLLLNLIGVISFFPLNRLFENVHFSWNINAGVVLAYIVLWIIIPEAKTVKQKLEMMGEEEYIQSIRERFSDNVASARSRAENENPPVNRTTYATAEVNNSDEKVTMEGMPPAPPATPSSGAARLSSSSEPQRSGCMNGFIILLKIIFFSFVGLIALVLVGLFLGFMFAGAQFLPLKSLFIDPGYESNLLIASLVLIILVPVVSIVIWIVRRAMKAKSRPVIGTISTILWFTGLVLAGILTSNIAQKFREESSKEAIIAVAPVNTQKMYVDMIPYNDDYSDFKIGFGHDSDIDELPFTTVNKDSLLFRSINLHIRKSSDSLFHVRTIAATHGKDLRLAKNDLEEFSYHIVQDDSLLYLPEFLAVPVSQGFRNQSITVEIAVPAGKSIEVSDVLSEYKNNEPPTVVRKRIRKYTSSFVPVDLGTTQEEAEGFKKV
ncbi:MAG: PspC domain-containing protein [Bacteroidales bacterium]|jgi:phage shock protein PspC (stress-responsive transcriptional regulator)|nr:PspC domain-containing protein [Bacteroidales bacterium]